MNPKDLVYLNIGGVKFATTITTLTQKSTYFQSMFRWYNDNQSDNANPTIFIDKDPEPFKYLLTYMREGIIDIPKENDGLARGIILQAHYFGLNEFVRVVKITSWRNSDLCSHKAVIDDDRALKDFDLYFDSFHDSFAESEFLPSAYHSEYSFKKISLRNGNQTWKIDREVLENYSNTIKKELIVSPWKKTFEFLHDEVAFGRIMNFLIYLQLDLPRTDVLLFQRILKIASELDIFEIIVYVKARTMVNIEKRSAPLGLDPIINCSLCLPIQVSDVHYLYAAYFDERFHGFERAFATGILPNGFFS